MWDCCVLVLNEQGEVQTMNTCRAFDDKKGWEVNWCLSKRQTGSAIKPFLYIFALQKLGLTWGSMIVDEPVSYYLDEEQIYSPKNFSLSYYGEVSLATALGSSLNIPAVKLLHDAGVEEFIAFINRLRQEIANTEPDLVHQESQTFNAHNLGLSVGLGTYELSPLEFASLWKVFLTSWALADEYQSTIAEVADILSKNQYRTISFWVDNYLNMPGWSVKSGTSRHFIDGRTCWVHTAKKKIRKLWCLSNEKKLKSNCRISLESRSKSALAPFQQIKNLNKASGFFFIYSLVKGWAYHLQNIFLQGLDWSFVHSWLDWAKRHSSHLYADHQDWVPSFG